MSIARIYCYGNIFIIKNFDVIKLFKTGEKFFLTLTVCVDSWLSG